MLTKLAVSVALAALAAAPAAAADGPGPFAQQGGPGVIVPAVDKGGPLRIVAVPATNGTNTVLEQIQTKDGQVRFSVDIVGAYGIPSIVYGAGGDSLSQDGRTLVLGQTGAGSTSGFLVYNTKTMQMIDSVTLPGQFSFDALSPDASRMYVIRHLDAKYSDYAHYVVRAVDLTTNRLLPGRIADHAQKSWVMDGFPITRTTSPGGRWVYTLYQNGGNGYPFIHALDTVRGVAHCIGLPMTNGLGNLQLSLHGSTLSVHWLSGRPWKNVNTSTWAVKTAHRAGFPWWTLGFLVVLPVGYFARKRRRRADLDQELAVLLADTEAVDSLLV
ncbi:MAG TPA: hypothetical protein VFM96_06345 [Gaiellaceae bacterium]|nr:hypothetical protein [Gaiellaceae bacterium]